MKILVFDNYDSFTYNLVHLVEKITHEKVSVFRNDQIPLEKIKEYDRIILSPGPGIPSEAGLLLDVIREYAPTKSFKRFSWCSHSLSSVNQQLSTFQGLTRAN